MAIDLHLAKSTYIQIHIQLVAKKLKVTSEHLRKN